LTSSADLLFSKVSLPNFGVNKIKLIVMLIINARCNK
jgi:hypothetical protein